MSVEVHENLTRIMGRINKYNYECLLECAVFTCTEVAGKFWHPRSSQAPDKMYAREILRLLIYYATFVLKSYFADITY